MATTAVRGWSLNKGARPFDSGGRVSTIGAMASIDERLIDKRIVERNLERGLLSAEQRKAYLDGLPDRAANADVIPMHDPSVDDDDDDDGLDTPDEDA
jgi:hypothetical protein